MSGWNSALAYSGASLESVQEAIGVPQFSGAAGESWYFVFNGMIFQGGKILVPSAITAFDFATAFTQQVLGVWLQPETRGHSPGVTTTLSQFTVDHSGVSDDMYWFAIGV